MSVDVDGSPPRVWGPQWSGGVLAPNGRFTPTRVGTTQTIDTQAHQAPVHPHACGDHLARVVHGGQSTGSPPRVWGPH